MALEQTHCVTYNVLVPIHQQLVPLPPKFPPAKQGSKAFAFPEHNLMVSVQAGWYFKCSIQIDNVELTYPEWTEDIQTNMETNSVFRALGASSNIPELQDFPQDKVVSYEIIVMSLTGGALSRDQIRARCPCAIVPDAYTCIEGLPCGANTRCRTPPTINTTVHSSRTSSTTTMHNKLNHMAFLSQTIILIAILIGCQCHVRAVQCSPSHLRVYRLPWKHVCSLAAA